MLLCIKVSVPYGDKVRERDRTICICLELNKYLRNYSRTLGIAMRDHIHMYAFKSMKLTIGYNLVKQNIHYTLNWKFVPLKKSCGNELTDYFYYVVTKTILNSECMSFVAQWKASITGQSFLAKKYIYFFGWKSKVWRKCVTTEVIQ